MMFYVVSNVKLIPYTVRMLQASNDMWVRVYEPDNVGEPIKPNSWSGLLCMEQWPEPTLLQLQLMQSWAIGEPKKGMEEG